MLKYQVTAPCGEIVAQGKRSVTVNAQTSSEVFVLDLADQLEAHGSDNLLVWLWLWESDVLVSSNLILFEVPKQLNLYDPQIDVQLTCVKERVAEIRLCARAPALWVWLELDECEARFSDNFFHLLPGMPSTIHIDCYRALPPLASALSVRSLFDSW